MARVVVNDCLDFVPNRFDLILFAARRAKELGEGKPQLVDPDTDKNSVLALREIASGAHRAADLENRFVEGLRRFPETDEEEEEPPVFDRVNEAAMREAVRSANGQKIKLDVRE